MPFLVYVMNDQGSRICVLCFVIVDFFWLICCIWIRIIFICSVRELVSLCSMAECVKVCQHFELSYTVQISLQVYSMWKLAKVVGYLTVGSGFGIWRGDKRPCIIQRELSAAPVLPGIPCLRRVHLCAHWKIFVNESNFAW